MNAIMTLRARYRDFMTSENKSVESQYRGDWANKPSIGKPKGLDLDWFDESAKQNAAKKRTCG